MKQIAGIVKTDTQNRKAIYKVLKMDKVPDGTNVLLAFLGHPRFIKMFKEDHPSSKITVLENKDLSWLFFNSPYDVKLVDPVNINLIKEILKDMKFDYIIMNPPYNGNLHLKILEEAMKHSDNVVNLSPVRWLQDPLAILKPHSDYNRFLSIRSHIKNIEIVDAATAIKIFTAGASADLGIYTMSSAELKPFEYIANKDYEPFLNKVSRVVYKKSGLDTVMTKKPTTDFFVNMPEIHGHNNNKDWCDIISPEKNIARSQSKGTHARYISFDTEEEAENFRLSLMTDFERFCSLCVKMNFCVIKEAIPYMGNEINPRTGLKGYESEWTDEDFYKFFDLTNDEIKIIEDTMKKYEV